MITLLSKITLYKKHKGRNTPFKSGYRPLFDFPNVKMKISGSIELIDSHNFEPGTTGIVNITFWEGIIDSGYFKPGQQFEFGEGISHTGEGEFLEVVNQWENP